VLDANEGMTYALPIAAVAAIALIWLVNIPGMNVATKLITALSPSSSGIDGNFATFQDLAAHPSFAAQEIREQLVSFAASVVQSSSATNTQKQQVLTLAVTEMQKQIASYPLDAREHLELSYTYRAGGDSADALKELQTAAVLSPKKEQIWIEEGSVEWDLGDIASAQADFNKAYALGPQFQDLAMYAAAGDIAVGDTAAADKILMSVFGTTSVDSDILAVAYYRAKDWQPLIALWKARAALPGATATTWFSFAAAYYAAGDNADAIATINKAVALFPDAASSGAAAIKQIEGKAAGQ
jgi:tetratricopeptide (TPR) repeat protein